MVDIDVQPLRNVITHMQDQPYAPVGMASVSCEMQDLPSHLTSEAQSLLNFAPSIQAVQTSSPET